MDSVARAGESFSHLEVSGRALNVKKAKINREPLEEIDLLDDMHSALVDLLIEKGIITEEEYEKRIKQRVKIK